jgi:hypothetical protein
MPVRYDIVHTTVYRYRQPVTFGEHRVMFRPRDSHDLRVLATDLDVSPESDVRMIQDPLSNSVALVQPLEKADTLQIVCSFTIEHAHSMNLELPLSPSAEFFPFAYYARRALRPRALPEPLSRRPDGELTAWARQFIRTDGPTGTRDLLVAMNQHIRDKFRYAARDEEGTQTAARDAQARQRLVPRLRPADDGGGAPPRLRDPLRLRLPVRPGPRRRRGAAAPSAPATPMPGCQAYLPGAGWVPFDPTNNLLGGTQLIRVGIAATRAGGADLGQLVRRERRLPRHGRQRHRAAASSRPRRQKPPGRRHAPRARQRREAPRDAPGLPRA